MGKGEGKDRGMGRERAWEGRNRLPAEPFPQ